MFLSRDAIEAWATHLELELAVVHAANEPYIELAGPQRRDDGSTVVGPASLGQSVCVLKRR